MSDVRTCVRAYVRSAECYVPYVPTSGVLAPRPRTPHPTLAPRTPP